MSRLHLEPPPPEGGTPYRGNVPQVLTRRARAAFPTHLITHQLTHPPRLRADGFVLDDPVVTLFFQLQRQVFRPGADDAAVVEDMHEIGDNIVQQPLVM